MQTLVSKAVSTLPTIGGLHHYAYKCRDAEETRYFYEDVLGMPLAHVMEVRDLTSTTGELVSFVHIFFKMGDGSYLAFFDLGDGKACAKDPATPPFTIHLALHVDGETALQAFIRRLEEAGVAYQGPLDQEGFVRSVYFWDPNGVRLELTYEIGSGELAADHDAKGRELLKRWTREHRVLTPAE